MKAAPIAGLLLLLAGLSACSTPTQDFLVASRTFTSTVHSLVEAREGGLIPDDDWARLKAIAKQVDFMFDEWDKSIAAGNDYPLARDTLRLVRALVAANAEYLE